MAGLGLAYKPKNENVAQNIGNVIKTSGPLMQLARTEGLKVANQRGLLSSSIAAGTSEREVLKAAAPIGAQQASQNFQANQTQAGFENAFALQNDAQQQQASLARADRNLQVRLQQRQIAGDRAMKLLDRETQTRLTSMNLAAADRAQLATTLAAYQNTYEQQVEAINANKLLKADARAQQLSDLRLRRENLLKFYSKLYNVDIAWPSTAAAPARPAANAPAKPAAKPAPAKQATKPAPTPARGYADSTGWHNY